jgi:hypothetical protein
LAVLVDTIDELVVEVASTRSWSRCPHVRVPLSQGA